MNFQEPRPIYVFFYRYFVVFALFDVIFKPPTKCDTQYSVFIQIKNLLYVYSVMNQQYSAVFSLSPNCTDLLQASQNQKQSSVGNVSIAVVGNLSTPAPLISMSRSCQSRGHLKVTVNLEV